MLLPWEIIMYEGFIINTLHWKIYTSGSQTVGKALYMDVHFERCLHPNEIACCQSNRWWFKPDLIEMLDDMEPKKTSRQHSLISKKMIRVDNFATARQNLEKKEKKCDWFSKMCEIFENLHPGRSSHFQCLGRKVKMHRKGYVYQNTCVCMGSVEWNNKSWTFFKK